MGPRPGALANTRRRPRHRQRARGRARRPLAGDADLLLRRLEHADARGRRRRPRLRDAAADRSAPADTHLGDRRLRGLRGRRAGLRGCRGRAERLPTFAGSRPADLWLLLGDNAYNSGTDAEFTAGFFNVYPTIMQSTPVWPVPGNHEFGAPTPRRSRVPTTIRSPCRRPARRAACRAARRPTTRSTGPTSTSSPSTRTTRTARRRRAPRRTCARRAREARCTSGCARTWPPPTRISSSRTGTTRRTPRARTTRTTRSIRRPHAGDARALPAHARRLRRGPRAHRSQPQLRALALARRSLWRVEHVRPLLHAVDAGDGDPAGDGAYQKPVLGTSPRVGRASTPWWEARPRSRAGRSTTR